MTALIALEAVEYRPACREGTQESALTGVNLSVNAGDRLAILGRNGSGKTTLLGIMAGLLDPSGGAAFYRGDPYSTLGDPLCGRKVAMVSSDADTMILGATVEEDVAFGLFQQDGLSERQISERIDEVLEFLELEDFRRFSPAEMNSSGRYRLALASALAVRPEVLLLDEPWRWLDEPGRRLLDLAINRLSSAGGAVVRSTHDVTEAANSSSVLVLDGGEVVAQGKAPEVLTQLEALQRWGLRVPAALELSAYLCQAGVMHEPVFSVEMLVNRLCR